MSVDTLGVGGASLAAAPAVPTSGTSDRTASRSPGTSLPAQPAIAAANPSPTASATATPTLGPTPTPTPTPTLAPVVQTPAPPPPPPPTPAPRNLCGAPPNPWNYNLCGGSVIYNPPSNFCSYFPCIPSFWNQTNGYVELCTDGEYSHSGGVRGSCSYHGGNRQPLYQ